MGHRDRTFRVKLLVGTAIAILMVDVLMLAVLVVPLRASQRVVANTRERYVRPTQTIKNQVLMLPTRDPSKPWPTRTPLPTATPWLEAAIRLAAQHQAALAATRSAAQVLENPTEPGAARGTASPTAPIESSPAITAPAMTAPATPPEGSADGPVMTTLQGDATPRDKVTATNTPTTTLTAGLAAGPTGTVTPTATLPDPTPAPTATLPDPTPAPATPQPAPPIAAGDEAQLITYLQDHYNTIAGQPLDIVAVTLGTAETGIPMVTVELSGDAANSVFAAQTEAVVVDYGRRLLNDAKLYFNGQSCAISVVDRYDTSNPDACTNVPGWCSVTGYDESNNSWSVIQTYVWGTSTEGADEVARTWNPGP